MTFERSKVRHYSGIDYEHFLDDIRDMYPFSIQEAVLVEIIANSLDAKSTLIDIRVDPDRNSVELTDNGTGMDSRGFEMYHNFSTSFKRKGHGIGFAGLGAKLALKISDSIITETRQSDEVRTRTDTVKKQKKGRRPTNFWSSSEWKFERKGKVSLPVWYDVEQRTLMHHGTRICIHFRNRSQGLSDPDEVKRIVLDHYLPLIELHEFYETVGLYKRVTILVNGDIVGPPSALDDSLIKTKHYILRRGRSRKPYGLAHFELFPSTLPESRQGIGIATFGKIIKRDFLKQHFPGMDRVTGIIEVPELVECLTTNKTDFRKDGTAGNKYYRFNRAAQQEFRRWLEELQIIEHTEIKSDREVRRLQRVVNTIIEQIPDLQQFYGARSERDVLVKDSAGGEYGSQTEPRALSEGGREGKEVRERVEVIEKALAEESHGEDIGKSGVMLGEGVDVSASRSMRSSKFGPVIKYVAVQERDDISWMEGDVVLINMAHPAYRKAAEKKVVEYHNLFAVAIAMLREVPTASEKLEVLEKFISRWGKM